MPAENRLLVSILSLGRPENLLRQLAGLPEWLEASGIAAHIVIRNNDPTVSFAAVAERVAEINESMGDVACTLITDGANTGFGGGHNANIATMESAYVLILNDDIGFPHMSWLAEAVAMLEQDPVMAAVAAEENPRHLSPLFGNGLLPGSFHLHGLVYGEASVLLCRRSALEEAGGFHADFAWAMCEDADLSLRWQQLGYSIGMVSMPHEHWRSSTFNTLPGPVKSSILEHNRAALFANWRESFATGSVGRFEIFDLWSDGIGDVFCALPHVLARLSATTARQRENVIVNTNHPEIFAWLGLPEIRRESEKDLSRLRQVLSGEGIATLRSTRESNFSLPFNIHPLLAGGLGIAPADTAAFAAFATKLQSLRPPPRLPAFEGKTVVFHTEFGRNHDGRAMSPGTAAGLAGLCQEMFDTLVLVGEEHRMALDPHGGGATIVDLQGKLSLAQLAGVMSRATHFVGIDSFPAHLAQAIALPAAIFFGAVHPLTRSWDRARVWPLAAKLDCLGCYHHHLEPSVPFCMRRDQACSWDLEEDALRGVLRQMLDGAPYDWRSFDASLHALQAKMLKLTKFHPMPPQRLFRADGTANEAVSNMIYGMTDQLGALLRGQYQTSTVTALSAQVQGLQTQIFAAKVDLEAARRQLREEQGNSLARADGRTPSLLQLGSIAAEPVRCRFTVQENWLEIDATDDDPQLLLPEIHGKGGKVQLRLSCMADAREAMQIYWAMDDEAFSTENLRTVPMDSGAASANLVMDLPHGHRMRLRIDPITGIGGARLHGSIGGVFSFDAPDAPSISAQASRKTVRVARRTAVH